VPGPFVVRAAVPLESYPGGSGAGASGSLHCGGRRGTTGGRGPPGHNGVDAAAEVGSAVPESESYPVAEDGAADTQRVEEVAGQAERGAGVSPGGASRSLSRATAAIQFEGGAGVFLGRSRRVRPWRTQSWVERE
jgi:hypothetical protein